MTNVIFDEPDAQGISLAWYGERLVGHIMQGAHEMFKGGHVWHLHCSIDNMDVVDVDLEKLRAYCLDAAIKKGMKPEWSAEDMKGKKK